MLALLALIGVTFATFSGQSKINARNFYLSVVTPQDDELMDFALSQLITDTGDVRSAIRGHSLARDMYGNDAFGNGYLPLHPTYGTPFYITSAPRLAQVGSALYTIFTNIQSNDPNFYGYNFTRWVMRVSYTGTLAHPVVTSPYQPPSAAPTTANSLSTETLVANQPVTQTFEIIADSGFNSASTVLRSFTIAVLDPPLTTNTSISGQIQGSASTNLINWGYNLPSTDTPVLPAASQLPSYYLELLSGNNGNPGTAFPFSLDGRWLHAFNGPGMGEAPNTITGLPNSTYGNFRYNAPLNVPGPNAAGMDEDYDACDLENWFLAIQSADGRVVVPSFHRPGIIRYDLAHNVNDWQRQNFDGPNGTPLFATSASRILRPCTKDGNDPATFPDLVPNQTSGQINYDVDNDGDGVTDSVWLDLGYPVRRDSRGQLMKPLFAFMVIGLNGRIPLNTAGNLAGLGATHAEHLGNSVSEIDMTDRKSVD
jgi:hypothetical protein